MASPPHQNLPGPAEVQVLDGEKATDASNDIEREYITGWRFYILSVA